MWAVPARVIVRGEAFVTSCPGAHGPFQGWGAVPVQGLRTKVRLGRLALEPRQAGTDLPPGGQGKPGCHLVAICRAHGYIHGSKFSRRCQETFFAGNRARVAFRHTWEVLALRGQAINIAAIMGLVGIIPSGAYVLPQGTLGPPAGKRTRWEGPGRILQGDVPFSKVPVGDNLDELRNGIWP